MIVSGCDLRDNTFTGSHSKSDENNFLLGGWRGPDRRPSFLLPYFYDETMNMNPQSVAQWLLDNPQDWFRVARSVAASYTISAEQIAEAFSQAAYEYDEDRDSDDSDDAQALASAGYGTDEDYGG